MPGPWYYFGPWQFRDGANWMPPESVAAVDLSPLTGGTFGVFRCDAEVADSAYKRISSAQGGEPITAIPMGPSRRAFLETTLGLSDAIPAGGSLADAIVNILTANSDPDGISGPKPLQATRRGQFELAFGEAVPVVSARMPSEIWRVPWWAKYQALMRRSYREVRELAQSLETDYKRRLHRRWLEVQRRKYRLTRELAKQLFIPDDLPQEDPEEPATTITDDFNRADQSGLGTSGEGWTWSAGGGATWSIASNLGAVTGSAFPGIAQANSDLSSADHYCEATVAHTGTQQDLMVGARKSGFSTGYGGAYYRLASSARFWKFTPSASNFGVVSAGAHASRLLRLEVDGSTQTLYIEGVSATTGTDTAISSGLRCGLWAWAGATGTFEDFLASDLGGGGIGIPVVMHHRRRQGVS